MLTRLHVQGFKSLLDVEVRFGPFTCIAGANGVGKSNLFDALRFLHLLTQYPLLEAAQKVRDAGGRTTDPSALFTRFGHYRAPEMRFTADLIVEREVSDDFGAQATAAISSLRYTVALALDETTGPSRLKLVEESLVPIPLLEARRSLGFSARKEFLASAISGRRTKPFISTERSANTVEITVHQEGHGGRKLPATSSLRTVVGGLATSEFPTILAVHRELASWRTLMLEPSAMRAPSRYHDPRVIDARGANVPAVLHRLQQVEDHPGRICAAAANQLAHLLQDVRDLRLVQDDRTETWTVEVCGRDGIYHPASALSDGTLRFLVLTVLSLDPEARGIICLEEPENGIHPGRMGAMVKLLKDIAVDTEYSLNEGNPLRQVLVNTHSPRVIQEMHRDDLIYLSDAWVKREGQGGRVTTVQVPPSTWRARLPQGRVPLVSGDLIDYLGNAADGWLAMDYHESENGIPAEVRPGR